MTEKSASVYIQPLETKLTLSAEEASQYSGIGINTIYRMMNNPKYNIVLWIGKKKRIKRAAFEQLIQDATIIDD